MARRIQFLNVDLDMSSERDLRPLARVLETFGVYTLHCRRDEKKKFVATFELDVHGRTMEATLRKFVKVIRGLPPMARRIWDEATQREFNAGFQAERRPRSFEAGVGPRTLRALVDLNARFAITIYAPSEVE